MYIPKLKLLLYKRHTYAMNLNHGTHKAPIPASYSSGHAK